MAVYNGCCEHGAELIYDSTDRRWYVGLLPPADADKGIQSYYRMSGEKIENGSNFADAVRVSDIDDQNNFYHHDGTDLVRVDINGTEAWTYTSSAGAGSINAFYIAPDRHCYVLATSLEGMGNDRNLHVYKIDTSGNEVWAFDKYASDTGTAPADLQYLGQSICVNHNGTLIHVSGYARSASIPNTEGPLEIRIDSDGNEVWSIIDYNDYSPPLGFYAQPISNTFDNGNNSITSYLPVISAGSDTRTLAIYDNSGIATLENTTSDNYPGDGLIEYYNNRLNHFMRASSTSVRLRRFSGSDYNTVDWDVTTTIGSGSVPALSIQRGRSAVDGAGNTYVAFRVVDTNNAVIIQKYDNNGTQIYSTLYTGNGLGAPLVSPGRSPCFIKS